MKFLLFIVSIPVGFLIMLLQLFFFPYAIVAKKRQDWPDSGGFTTVFFILNLAFGWTIIGWLVLLVIAQALPKS